MNHSIEALIAARKQRWINLYNHPETGGGLFVIRHWSELGERPFPRMDNIAERIDYAWRKYQLQIEQLTWLEDDSLPYLEPYTGTEIFAAAFGCPVYYPENDMPFAMPCIHSAEEVAGVDVPSLDVPALAALFEIADELQRRAGPGALLHLVDIQSPMDIAALIWDKVTFYPAMIQQPEAVQALAGKVYQLMVRFLDEWFNRYGREFVAHYPDYYMPAGLTLSEDEVGAVSGKMFERFFLPELVALSQRYGGLGLHCCAHARHQWQNFLKIPGLRLINFVQPPEVIREAVPFFQEHAVQWHSYAGQGDPWTWPTQQPPDARLVYEIWVNSKDEALEASARMRAALGRV